MQTEFYDLLLRLLEQPESERLAFLEASGADPALRAELLDLLARESDLDGFLNRPAGVGLGAMVDMTTPGGPETVVKSSRSALPSAIGPYTVKKVLGEGGMGIVYLAEQHEPVQRELAVKVIRADLAAPDAAARFAAERQALARLSHPHIAQLYEAGTTPEGYPYFAMEYFAGQAINDYCDQNRLLLEQRLSLFATVCDAVQHAHQRGIIHRDLKPSNILVAEIGGRPVAKIIDFGIAKAIDQPLTDALELTGEIVIGTPAYMSPESLRLSEGVIDVDTRTDVYSLGVLLYELLTGVRPFAVGGSNVAQMMAKMAGDDAPTPSTQLSLQTREIQAEAAFRRRTEAPALQRSLAGDLDWIVGMAIAKDREERYSSAAELAADIQRHLDHQPVVACPPSVRYRAAKFVRRNRTLVVAGVVAVLALLAGTIGTTIGMVRASQEAKRANREMSVANDVSEFLVSLFAISDPMKAKARGSTITARELLDRSAAEIGDGFQDQPLVRARFMLTIGRIYKNLGMYEEAERLMVQALKLREDEPRASVLDNTIWVNALAELYRLLGRFDEAVAAHTRALEIQEERLGSEHKAVAESLTGIGAIYSLQGRYQDAEPFLLRALEIREKVLEPGDSRIGKSINELALLYFKQGRYEKADPLYQRALAITEKADGPGSTYATQLNNIALLYDSQGRREEAEPMYRRALEIYEEILGPDHPDVARSLSNLALLYDKMARYEEAEPLYKRAIEINTAALGPDHWYVAICFNNLAVLYTHQKRFAEAGPIFQSALKIYEQALGTEHPRFARTLFRYAQWHVDQGRLAEAEPLLVRAMAIQEQKLPANHPKALATREEYADLLRATGRQEEAEALE